MLLSKIPVAVGVLCLALIGAGCADAANPVKNVVLVHGAFVDGSGWQGVYEVLVKDGYHVDLVQQPLTSLEDDTAAAKRIIDRQDGPCILVGHSYGGSVITSAGTDPKVVGLVYIAAHAISEDETQADNGKKYPNSIRPFVKTADGYVFLDPANFPEDFAADLPKEQAQFIAHAQMPTAAKVFMARVPDPAWKHKPSWYMVAKADKTINPDLERMYAARAKSHTVEIEGASHAVYISHPKEVAALIEDAAQRAQP